MVYIRALHVRARLFSLLAAIAIIFAILVIAFVGIRYAGYLGTLPASAPQRNIDSAVITVLTRSAGLTIPALIIFVIAETLAWRNEAAITQERRHLEMLALQRQHLDALRQSVTNVTT